MQLYYLAVAARRGTPRNDENKDHPYSAIHNPQSTGAETTNAPNRKSKIVNRKLLKRDARPCVSTIVNYNRSPGKFTENYCFPRFARKMQLSSSRGDEKRLQTERDACPPWQGEKSWRQEDRPLAASVCDPGVLTIAGPVADRTEALSRCGHFSNRSRIQMHFGVGR